MSSDIEHVIQKAVSAFEFTKNLSSFERSEILKKIAQGIEKNSNDFSQTITHEIGKTIRESERETSRSINTFLGAAEEAKRINGEIISLDHLSTTPKRMALVSRFPIGPILAISPFNYPLNLVAHKVAPALASGNSLVLKPAPHAKETAQKLASIIQKSGLPEGAFAVVSCSNEETQAMVQDSRFKMLTFTGSAATGWALKAKAVKKKVILELGGIAATIIAQDYAPQKAIERCVYGAFSSAGQICISVQTIYVHETHFETFKDLFVKATLALKVADPMDPKTDVGPLIDENAAKRVESWIKEAKAQGATILCGGTRKGRFIDPSVLINVTLSMKVCSEEVFGPVVNLISFKDMKEVYADLKRLPYGLQAGIFTNHLPTLFQAYENIEVGGLIHNDIPTFRVDHMPYGGVKDSGFGREGLKYAIQEMTEMRMLALNLN